MKSQRVAMFEGVLQLAMRRRTMRQFCTAGAVLVVVIYIVMLGMVKC
jgi:hypothetical protein